MVFPLPIIQKRREEEERRERERESDEAEMKRSRIKNRRKDSKIFTRTAMKTKKINLGSGQMRGGVRL